MTLSSRLCRWLLPALLGAGLIATPACRAQTEPADLDDGPYVFQAEGRQLEALWICAGKLERQRLARTASTRIEPRCGYPHPLAIPAKLRAEDPPLPAGARIIAVSDIHGQYHLLLRLLRGNGVIDAHDRWAAGRDHLVIAGDVFDRGPQVTEALWLLFSLQQQARAAGGAVHYLLGNHETMALYGSQHYVNPKYLHSAEKIGRPYAALFAKDSVLGQWLRTRPALLKLGDTLFLHGGIAPENLDLARRMRRTNAIYRRTLGLPKDEVKASAASARLYDGKTSPIWYRGYFNGALDSAQVAALVDRLGLARIVVGHTTIGEVASFHDGRIIAIDSGIKRGQTGQLLFIDGDTLSRGTLDGRREPLPALREIPEDRD